MDIPSNITDIFLTGYAQNIFHNAFKVINIINFITVTGKTVLSELVFAHILCVFKKRSIEF